MNFFFQTEQRKAEQRKYGIEYDDDYDYLQHLKDPCAPPEKYSVNVNPTEEEEQDDDDDEDFDDYEDYFDDKPEEKEEETVKFEIFHEKIKRQRISFEKTVTRFNLPSTVFESKTTNEIGMLHLDAPDSGKTTRNQRLKNENLQSNFSFYFQKEKFIGIEMLLQHWMMKNLILKTMKIFSMMILC